MIFKILSTIAVGLFATVWSFQNLKFINDWIVTKTGIGLTMKEKQEARAERQAAAVEEVANVIEEPITIEPVAASANGPVVVPKK